MRISVAGFVLPIIGLVLEIWLAVVLLRQKIQDRFPFFVTYIVYAAVAESIRRVVSGHYSIYFYIYWSTEAAFAVLAILALHEAYRWIFALFYQSWWFRLIFWAVVAIISLVSIRMALLHPPIQAPTLIRIIFSLEIGVHYIQAGLFGLMFLLVVFFRLRWRFRPYGIVMGFAASALGSSAAFWVRSEFGTKYETLVQYGPPVAYILAVAIWLDAFLSPQEQDAEDKWAETFDPHKALAGVREGVKGLNEFLRSFRRKSK